MGNRISKLYNANVYLDGDSYAGLAEEVTAPDLKPKMTEHKALSNIGSFELPTGLDKMGMKIKWNTVNADVMRTSADFYNSKNIMIRANIDEWEDGSKAASVPCIMFIRGLSKTLPAVGFKHQDNAEVESEFSVTGYRLEIAGVEVFNIDLFANVYIVDGEDMLADYRANLGL
jgi:P2 family phage contractile tail tube protein